MRYLPKGKKAWLLAMLCCIMLLPGAAGAKAPGNNVLRLHVIANSDSAPDQQVKLMVRDAVLSMVEARPSAAAARAYVMENGGAIQRAVERTLTENGFSYGAQLCLGVSAFPDKSYGSAFFPAGEYEALRIVLGEGKGRNWWCVLFPPLCIVTEGEADEAPGQELSFHSSILRWFKQRRAGK